MIKKTFYHLCKWLGLFRLSSIISENGLQILCYHGFALDDEASFLPRLFIKPSTFRERMKFLSDSGFHVIPLSDALELLARRDLPPNCVVLTIDDGFAGVYQRALPILLQFQFPVTTYVTSYNVLKETPVFSLFIQYLFWRTEKQQLIMEGLDLPLEPVMSISSPSEKERLIERITEFGENRLDEPGRGQLARALAGRLGLDYQRIVHSRILSMMTAAEIRAAISSGMDIQLHTHRHRLPIDHGQLLREIADNRAVLEPMVGKSLQHLCYPSGIWSQEQWSSLTEAGILSAMTCIPGLNYPDTPRLGLKRFLDGEHITSIEFEAELRGFTDLLRRGRSFLTKKLQPESNSLRTATSRYSS